MGNKGVQIKVKTTAQDVADPLAEPVVPLKELTPELR